MDVEKFESEKLHPDTESDHKKKKKREKIVKSELDMDVSDIIATADQAIKESYDLLAENTDEIDRNGVVNKKISTDRKDAAAREYCRKKDKIERNDKTENEPEIERDYEEWNDIFDNGF